MAPVSIRNVRKSFGSGLVLKGVSLDIADGDFIALVGPSGCGKSTLLRMIAGLESISDGTIAIDGQTVNDLLPKDRDVAMVFQSYALYPQMTVLENIGFPLRLRKVAPREIERRAGEVASSLNLTPYLSRFPRQLSGGQRQRVAMGRAIIRNPRAFLFDEPLSNLDAKLRVQMRTEIKALHQRLATTSVYVTHDQIEAMTLADRVVVMNEGVIEQAGAPLDLYDMPANLFVAGFIGSPAMNFLTGKIIADTEAKAVSVNGDLLQLPGLPAAWHGRTVTVGIRPEHFEISDGDGLAGRIVVVEPTGAETHIAVSVGSALVTMTSNARLELRPNEAVRLKPRDGCIHLFDEESARLDLAEAAKGQSNRMRSNR